MAAACVGNVLIKSKLLIQLKPPYPCRYKLLHDKNYRKGPFYSDRMHNMENFLHEHPLFKTHKKLDGRHPGENKTLKQLLEELNAKDPDLHNPIDIGLPSSTKSSGKMHRERRLMIEKIKSDEQLEKLSRTRQLDLPLDVVKNDWEKSEDGARQMKIIAQHYGIFQDLYEGAFFYPRVPITVQFPFDQDTITPVYRGNHVKPAEARVPPTVSFEAEPDSLWTLVLTNLDGHLLDSTSEYLHWFIGNIPGNDLSKGELICDYMQPFPARGTGFHRFVFILYKQNDRVDYSQLKKNIPCTSLSARTFKTFDFYSDRQDALTPASLAFFQSDWDPSVKHVFHHTLNMREPNFEYDFPPPRVVQQKVHPMSRPFNLYLDKYRDPKDLGQEILMKRLKTVHPFEGETPKEKYPLAKAYKRGTPSWLVTERLKESLRLGKYRGLDVEIEKPERAIKPVLGYKRLDDGTYRPIIK